MTNHVLAEALYLYLVEGVPLFPSKGNNGILDELGLDGSAQAKQEMREIFVSKGVKLGHSTHARSKGEDCGKYENCGVTHKDMQEFVRSGSKNVHRWLEEKCLDQTDDFGDDYFEDQSFNRGRSSPSLNNPNAQPKGIQKYDKWALLETALFAFIFFKVGQSVDGSLLKGIFYFLSGVGVLGFIKAAIDNFFRK